MARAGARPRRETAAMNDDLSGKKLDRYRIERLLGRGGMGAVYAGTDEESGLLVPNSSPRPPT